MENKLGLCEGKLIDIERKIVNLKMNLLDEYITFNKDIFDFEYIIELHKFLFSDFYYDYQLETRKLTEIETQYINYLLNTIENICINEPENLEKLLSCIHNIWDLQPFFNGNTRTLLSYLNVLNQAFMLDLNIDLNSNIISKPSTFNKENFVNQKRLTKLK